MLTSASGTDTPSLSNSGRGRPTGRSDPPTPERAGERRGCLAGGSAPPIRASEEHLRGASFRGPGSARPVPSRPRGGSFPGRESLDGAGDLSVGLAVLGGRGGTFGEEAAPVPRFQKRAPLARCHPRCRRERSAPGARGRTGPTFPRSPPVQRQQLGDVESASEL